MIAFTVEENRYLCCGSGSMLHSVVRGLRRLRLVEAALEKNPVLARRVLPNVRRSCGLCNFRPRTGGRARLGFRGRSDETPHALQRQRGSDVRIIAEDLNGGDLVTHAVEGARKQAQIAADAEARAGTPTLVLARQVSMPAAARPGARTEGVLRFPLMVTAELPPEVRLL